MQRIEQKDAKETKNYLRCLCLLLFLSVRSVGRPIELLQQLLPYAA